MKVPNLFDHLYFESETLRYRVLGPFVCGGTVSIILRAVYNGASWMKPPVYATENADPSIASVLSRFGKAKIAGREFPAVEIERLDSGISPFRWKTEHRVSDESRDLIVAFEQDASIGASLDWGLAGSRLLGYEKPKSDLDLVLGVQGENLREQILACVGPDSRKNPEDHSQRARLFFSIYDGLNSAKATRNVFGGLWRGLRVDLFSTFPQNAIASIRTLSQTQELISQESWTFRVLADAGRIAYPVHLIGIGVSPPFRRMSLFTFDTSMHYALVGDVVTVRNLQFSKDSENCTGSFHSAINVR